MSRVRVVGLLVLGLLAAPGGARASPEPPAQPREGPGGAAYPHADVRKAVYGEGPLSYWLYEPANPIPASAPLMVFNHGWGGTNPKAYGAWIRHLVRRGNIVVYPIYQEAATMRFPTAQITPNAIRAVKDAIARLQSGGHVQPELNHVAIVGHSAGGMITANMAALAASVGLPPPQAIMCVEPGKSWNPPRRQSVPLEEMRRIPPATRVLAVVGDHDRIAQDVDAKRIIRETTQVPRANKRFVVVASDEHGRPGLIADHFSPLAGDVSYDAGATQSRAKGTRLGGFLRRRFEAKIYGPQSQEGDLSRTLNALDYYGYWTLFDRLCDAAFAGRSVAQAFEMTNERFMGRWSDGTPVKELVLTDSP